MRENNIWNSLIHFQQKTIDFLNLKCENYVEPELLKFDQSDKNWLNKVWRNESVRRAHIDVVDARNTKGLWMMHLCIFPKFHNTAPIYGFDVIAGKNKITGLFHDFSPTIRTRHLMNEVFKINISSFKPSKERNLPVWAQNIFSKNMIAAGNVKEKSEIDNLLNICEKNLKYYLNIISYYDHSGNTSIIEDAQNNYCKNQKRNPHTPKVMKSLGLDENDVEVFCSDVLFPTTK